MSALTVSFTGVLVRRCPLLVPLFQEHLDDQEGEVLPHLFLADVERWCESALSDGLDDDVQSVLDALEDEFEIGGDEIEELVAVSFLEHLPRSGEAASLRRRLGPQLTAELDRLDHS